MYSQVRVIILNYLRWGNVDAIVKALHPYCKITVINNLVGHQYSNEHADVVNNDHNKKCMVRWHAAYDYPEAYKLILDDDMLVHPNSIPTLIDNCEHITGIMGYKGVNKANNYFDLSRVFNSEDSVDFLVGSVIMVRQSSLDKIRDKVKKIPFLVRGDDITISYLLKNKFNLDLQTTKCKIQLLPEKDTGLNLYKDHYKLRWNVIEKFKKLGWT